MISTPDRSQRSSGITGQVAGPLHASPPPCPGKSTLFNMLTGMCSSTSGSAAIFGYNISDPNQMAEIRKMTGICPQHDILFDELTPREHLTFFARIRVSPLLNAL